MEGAHIMIPLSSENSVLEAFIVDINGIARGKWLPGGRADSVLSRGMPMPLSAYVLDIWGDDVPEAGVSVDVGDPDGLALPVQWTLADVPWLSRPTRQLLLSMVERDGTPFFADPRHVLAQILARFEPLGLTPVVATEIEFYLIDRTRGQHGSALPPAGAENGWSGWQTQTLSIDALHAHESILSSMQKACAMQAIPADTSLRENGPSQYEINVLHCDDALRAADHAFLLKRIVRGVARQHGVEATFMAVPYGLYAGSGLHVHVSLNDREGRNVFAAGEPPDPSQGGPSAGLPDSLLWAVGGQLASIQDAMLFFAPHLNSYRRMRPDALVSSRVAWGVDNRTSAVRVIRAGGATRFENRVAGADANPYLVVAAILAGVLHGLTGKLSPGEPEQGPVNTRRDRPLPRSWDDAIDRFGPCGFVREYFGERYQRLFHACKRAERDTFVRRITDVENEAYLSVV